MLNNERCDTNIIKENNNLEFRTYIKLSDKEATQKIIGGSGFFTDEEVKAAAELVELGFSKKGLSGYHFMMVETQGQLLGYACFGRILGTDDRYELYWLAVEPTMRRHGLGRSLLERVEKLSLSMNAQCIYVRTAGRQLYEPTHAFYYASGYSNIALLKDFYGPGDDQVIFMKKLDTFTIQAF
jgi:GNAT superfamily N-acetyltransferase